MNNKKTSKWSIHSIKTKICILVDVAVVITGLLLLLIYMPNVKKEVGFLTEDYMADLAVVYGSNLDNEIRKAGGDPGSVMSKSNLALTFNGESMSASESSYVYVVALNGTMLYHPDSEKIGQPADLDVIRLAADRVSAGKLVENGVISYDYQGAAKYAAIYVSMYREFILVVTTDQAEIFSPLNRINHMGIGGIIVIVILMVIIGLIWAGILVKPIVQITDETIRLSEMDFTDSPELKKLNQGKDEIGSMSRALSILRDELVGVVEKIKDQSKKITTASDNLSYSASETSSTMGQVETAVTEIAQGATSQASETQTATDSVVDMGRMVKETNEVVTELISYAEKMKESGHGAKSILGQLEKVNSRTEKYIEVIAKQTNTTNESAQKISEAASMITDIAEETNLLSLNASIEAARAGEQGKGFAVVAAQIQKLAEQSNQSAQQIGDIIAELLEDSEKAVVAVSDVRTSMKEQSEHIERTDQAFMAIQEEVDNSIEGIQRISEKTRQMDEVRTTVIDVVQSLTSIAEQNAASTEETSAAVTEVSAIIGGISDKSDELKRIADEMDDGMSVFKI